MTLTKEQRLEKLIAIAKENKKTIFHDDVSKDLNEATRFVLAFDIKAGKNKILTSLIYQSYSVWALKPINKLAFCKQFAKLFECNFGNNNKSYYMLNYKQGELVNAAQKQKLSYE